MPSIYQLKPAFQNLLRPGVKKLHDLGITANQVTLFAMFVSIALALFLYQYYSKHLPSALLLLFPLWMLIRMAFNAIDGMLAREFDQQSKLGAFYNELSDVIADTALYVSLIAFNFIDSRLLLFVTFLAILSEYAGVMAPLIGAERRYDGPMGKSDRAFAFGFLATLVVVFSWFSTRVDILTIIIQVIFITMSLLLGITIYNRIKNSIHSSNKNS